MKAEKLLITLCVFLTAFLIGGFALANDPSVLESINSDTYASLLETTTLLIPFAPPAIAASHKMLEDQKSLSIIIRKTAKRKRRQIGMGRKIFTDRVFHREKHMKYVGVDLLFLMERENAHKKDDQFNGWIILYRDFLFQQRRIRVCAFG